MNKKIFAILVSGLVLLSAVACGSDEDTETTGSESTSDTESHIIINGSDTDSDTTSDPESETEDPNIDPTEENPVFTDKSMKVVVITWNANIRSQTNLSEGSIAGGAKEGDILTVTGESTNWYRLEDNLFIAKSVVADAAGLEGFTEVNEQVVITGGSVNLRSYPSSDSDNSIRGSLVEGTVLTRVAVGESWSRVKYEITNADGVKEEKEYYIYNKYIKTASETDSETVDGR